MSETFAELLVQRLKAQASLWRSLTGNPTLVGTGREHAFRQLLYELVPRRYEVLEGTIAGDAGMRTRRQVDCMIVDTFDFPTLIRSGSLAVVLRKAVRAVIELKGTIVSIGRTRSEAFRDALIQVGRTKNQLQLGVDVITAMFLFADDITAAELRTWLEEAIETRNRWTSRDVQKKEREGLHDLVLPSYIVTSEGLVVEKLVTSTAYRFYETDPAVAVAFLVANLLRTVALPPQSTPRVVPAAGPDPHHDAPSSDLTAAYTEFAEHFGSPTLPNPSGPDLDLTDPQPSVS
jgi:hypothetical protein